MTIEFPKQGIKKPRKPTLILPPGVEMTAPSAEVVPLNAVKPVEEGMAPDWKSAPDALRQLANDIETGRLDKPNMIFIAMMAHHPQDHDMVAFPSYSWGDPPLDTVRAMGLLTQHLHSLSRGS